MGDASNGTGLTKSWVTASVPLQAQKIELNTLDNYAPNLWNTSILFFTIPDSVPRQKAYASLREGLSRTLNVLPILAGRVYSHADNRRKLYIDIDETAGAELGFEEHDGESEDDVVDSFPSDYAKLKADHFPQSLVAGRGAPQAILTAAPEGSPVFAAQANFMNGGMAIVFGLHHSIADAGAWSSVVKLWSKYTAEVSRGVSHVELSEYVFDETRERIARGSPGLNAIDNLLWTTDKAPETILRPIGSPTPKILVSQRPPALSSWGIWYFSPEKLKQLKDDATSTSSSQWISTMDALCALWWYRTSAFRNMSTRGHQTSSCRVTIDLRGRIQPAIHPFYLGNAMHAIAATAPVSELEGVTEDVALATIAQKTRKAILEWKPEAYDEWMGLANTLPLDQIIRYTTLNILEPNIMMNDHSKLEAYGLDWGLELGSIDRVRRVETGVPVKGIHLCLFLPKLSNGGIELATLFDNDTLDAMRKDEFLLRYAEFRCA